VVCSLCSRETLLATGVKDRLDRLSISELFSDKWEASSKNCYQLMRTLQSFCKHRVMKPLMFEFVIFEVNCKGFSSIADIRLAIEFEA
jgi:hypothetical protein